MKPPNLRAMAGTLVVSGVFLRALVAPTAHGAASDTMFMERLTAKTAEAVEEAVAKQVTRRELANAGARSASLPY